MLSYVNKLNLNSPLTLIYVKDDFNYNNCNILRLRLVKVWHGRFFSICANFAVRSEESQVAFAKND